MDDSFIVLWTEHKAKSTLKKAQRNLRKVRQAAVKGKSAFFSEAKTWHLTPFLLRLLLGLPTRLMKHWWAAACKMYPDQHMQSICKMCCHEDGTPWAIWQCQGLLWRTQGFG